MAREDREYWVGRGSKSATGVQYENECSLPRWSFFTGTNSTDMNKSLDFNRRLLEYAAVIEAKSLVVITGGSRSVEKDLAAARERVLEGFRYILERARSSLQSLMHLIFWMS